MCIYIYIGERGWAKRCKILAEKPSAASRQV